MEALIPYDVIREIVSFVPDIDVRRAFGVFNKLNMKEHEHLNYVMRRPVQTAPWPDWAWAATPTYYHRYLLMNRVDMRAPGICDDTNVIFVYINSNEVKYYFYMFRLALSNTERFTNYIYSLS